MTSSSFMYSSANYIVRLNPIQAVIGLFINFVTLSQLTHGGSFIIIKLDCPNNHLISAACC